MAKPNPFEYIPILQAALEQEIGLVVEVTNPKAFRAYLYEARKLADDPRLDEIIFFLPASGDKIFLARKSVELEP